MFEIDSAFIWNCSVSKFKSFSNYISSLFEQVKAIYSFKSTFKFHNFINFRI